MKSHSKIHKREQEVDNSEQQMCVQASSVNSIKNGQA